MNPLLNLTYETAIESLGNEYYDDVQAAEFPQHSLRFRNDDLLTKLNLNPHDVKNEHFIEAFGKFTGHSRPFLALCYHGYQFGQYNPALGDGRGFLYGQVRGTDGQLYDFGTKGSGRTPYSRGGDGMLTLKGGVREIIAAETLYQMGVNTSRCLSMIETGLSLYRGDEPSPTRSSVMVRFNKSHIRFGTFERLHYLGRQDLIKKLLDHVIYYYYPHLLPENEIDRYGLFYDELIERVAKLASQWMAAGFCHAVLNTDNMSITGESFDYGPFAFIPSYDMDFTAAYFDYSGRYSYGNQPGICKLNLQLLQKPLGMVMSAEEMEKSIDRFEDIYLDSYKGLMLAKLGLVGEVTPQYYDFLITTLQLLAESQVSYHGFFAWLRDKVSNNWQNDLNSMLTDGDILEELLRVGRWESWRNAYHEILSQLNPQQLKNVVNNLEKNNLKTVPLRPIIESIWEPITTEDDWQPFYDLLAKIKERS